jgi:hypothetical protein
LAAIKSRVLVTAFIFGVAQYVMRFRRETDGERPVRTQGRHFRENVRVANQLQRERVLGFLDFLLGGLSRAVIGDRSGCDENIRLPDPMHHRFMHLNRAVHIDPLDTGRGFKLTGPLTSRTRAPASAAASATAKPIRPVLRLLIKRTGSSASRVGPAVNSTVNPCRSCGASGQEG